MLLWSHVERPYRGLLPPLVVGRGQRPRRGQPGVGDGGDQCDQGVGPVPFAVRDLVLHNPDVPGLVLLQALAAGGRLEHGLPLVPRDLRVDQP